MSPSTLTLVTLGGSPDRLLWDLELLGLFASLVFHDRDAYGVDVDASAIKLAPGQVEAAAEGLLRFCD